MRLLSACTLSTVFIASCGSGAAGPTSPAPPAKVAGTWSGTSTKTVTAGPACIGRQPITGPAMVQISQSGATISGTFDNCSFHGTVSDTTFGWTQDAQQADFRCQVAYPLFCISGGGIEIIFVRAKTSSIVGTVAGTQISASGSSADDIVDPTGQAIGTVQFAVRLTLQRQ
jgi:hypothetical protein